MYFYPDRLIVLKGHGFIAMGIYVSLHKRMANWYQYWKLSQLFLTVMVCSWSTFLFALTLTIHGKRLRAQNLLLRALIYTYIDDHLVPWKLTYLFLPELV